MAQAGQVLSADEVREYIAYHNAGVALPDKFAGIVVEATDPRGAVYRYPTGEERKAADEAARAAELAAAADAKLNERIRAEAAKRSEVMPPPMPDGPALKA